MIRAMSGGLTRNDKNENPKSRLVSCAWPNLILKRPFMLSENKRRTPKAQGETPATKEPQQSPFAGCSIIIAAGVMMLFLIGFTLWSLFKVDNELSKFTESKPVPTPVLDPLKFTTEFNDLSHRLDNFKAKVMAKEPAELTFSTEDLNLSIAANSQFEELRETFYIRSLSPDKAEVQISYRINGKPMGDKSFRYLNGTFIGKPRLESGQLLIDIEKIHSNCGIVPEQFSNHLSDHQITAPYLKDKVLGPFMKQLTSIELTNNGLIVRIDPAQEPPGQQELTLADIEKTKKIAITAFASVLALFGLLLFVFLKWRGTK